MLSRASVSVNNGNQGVDTFTAVYEDKSTPSNRAGVLIKEDELGAHLGTEIGLRTRSYIAALQISQEPDDVVGDKALQTLTAAHPS